MRNPWTDNSVGKAWGGGGVGWNKGDICTTFNNTDDF